MIFKRDIRDGHVINIERNMQNTARDTQPVSFSDVEQAIRSNPKRNMKLESITSIHPVVSTIDSILWMPKGWV